MLLEECNWGVCTVADVEGDTLLEKEQSLVLYLFVLFTMYPVLCAAGKFSRGSIHHCIVHIKLQLVKYTLFSFEYSMSMSLDVSV